MKAQVIGYRSMNFTSKSTGEAIEGTQLYYAYPANEVTGQTVDKKFIRKGGIELPSGLAPNCYVNLDFDGNSRLLGVTMLAK